VVGQAVEAMSAIAKSSQQISQIIGVIDEIAFQTNLLASTPGSSGARRRGGSRVRGRRLRSAGAGATFGASRQGDQSADLRLGWPGRGRRQAGGRDRSLARAHHDAGDRDQRRGRRHRRRSAGAIDRAAGDQHGDRTDESGDAAERRDGRAIDRRRPFPFGGILEAGAIGRSVPGRPAGRRRGAAPRIDGGRAARLPATRQDAARLGACRSGDASGARNASAPVRAKAASAAPAGEWTEF